MSRYRIVKTDVSWRVQEWVWWCPFWQTVSECPTLEQAEHDVANFQALYAPKGVK